MGFFSSIGSAISKPFRGIGRIVRGKFKEGLGDLADTAETFAPALALTGLGAPAAIGIGAGAGALSSLNDDRSVLQGALGGGAKTGAAYALKGIGSKLGGGGGAGTATAGAPVAPGSMVQTVAPITKTVTESAGRGLGSRLGGALSGVGSYLQENPEVAIAAGEGLGGIAQGRADSRLMDLREAEFERQNDPRQWARDLLLSGGWRLGSY